MSDSFYLSDLSERDKPWDIHRAQSDQVRDLYLTGGFFHYADRIDDCATWLAFVLGSADDGERRFRLQQARFCRHRHCPICQWRRSMTWKARFLKALPAITEAHPTARWVLLTLTVKNCPMGELRGTIGHMNRSFIRLTRMKKYPAIGWVKSLEVTKEKEENVDGLYAHPHFHVLMLLESNYFGGRSYINQKQWRGMWQKCLQVDYDPIIDIRTIKPNKEAKNSSSKSIESGLKETLKYTVKPSDLIADSEWLSALTEQLFRTRAITLGGCLKAYLSEHEPTDQELIQGEDNLEDQPVLEEDDPWVDFFWVEKVRKYRGKVREYLLE